MSTQSLPFRLAATSMVVAIVTSALLIAGVQLLLEHVNNVNLHARLADRASAASSSVRVGAPGIRVVQPKSTLLEQSAWIFDTSGRLRSGRLSESNDRASDEVRELSTATSEQRVSYGDLVLLARPVVRDGRRVATVVVAEDEQPYENSELHAFWLTLGVALVSVLVATAAAWTAASRSLRRVVDMAVTADEWREHDLGARFEPGPGGDEIAHLGRTLDTMLDRIAEALSAERRLTDEIAHELRTPLAVIVAEAELARATVREQERQSLDAIHEAALGMGVAIDTMLAVARGDSGSQRVSRLGDLVTALGQPPTELDEVLLAAPTPLLVAAVRPLLENAERHGAGRPRLEVSRAPRHLLLSVVDDGPGVPPDQLESVFEPGRSSRPDSSGLGLPLARRMARAAGARLEARPGPGGRFELHIPVH